MPAGRPRTPSRGRPPKKGGRSQSSSRKAKSPPKKAKSPAKKAKTPQKATPKPRSNSRSRKPSTAPAAVKHHQQSSASRSASPRSKTSTSKSKTNSITTRGTLPRVAVTVTSSHVPRSSASPAQLRSRTLGAALSQAGQRSPAERKPQQQIGWRQMIKNNVVTRQLNQLGRRIKQGPRPMVKNVTKHLKTNWKYWLLAITFFLLAGLIFKFQRELLVNVQQINKQVLEFVQQQYDQQRKIFGVYWQNMHEALEQAQQQYLTTGDRTPSEEPINPPPTSPPKPMRSPHLTD